MADIFAGQQVTSAEGEAVGMVTRVDESGFSVRADFLGAEIRCSRSDVAGLRDGVLALSLARDQLRERSRLPGTGKPAETPSLRKAQRRGEPGSSPTQSGPLAQGGERLEPADEEPQGGERLELGNDASTPRPP